MPKMSCREVAERVSRWTNVTKVIMGICFSILFLLGMILFIASCVALGGFSVFSVLGIHQVKSVIAFALCLGLFIAIVSILGALGYFTLHRGMLVGFVIGIAILIVLQVICGATAFAYRKDFANITADAWVKLNVSSDEDAIIFLEETFKCCGSYNFSDAVNSSYCNVSEHLNFFINDAGSLLLPNLYIAETNTTGCIPKIAEDLTDNINSVCIGDIVITILEVVVIVVTAFVLHEVKNANSYKQFQDDPSLESIHG